MKLGVSYNAFNGTEHLFASLNAIRDSVDYVSIVWQSKSNWGNPISKDDEKNLANIALIDDMVTDWVEFVPDLNLTPKQNELNKRNIGLSLSKDKGCTHHMSIDCDEVYKINQFQYAKEIAEKLDSTYCLMQTYYGDKLHRFAKPESYFVPFIYKIDDRQFKMFKNYPVLVDPSRKMEARNHYCFSRLQIEMHHYSWVRKNIRNKFENASASVNRTQQQIDEMVDYYESWLGQNKALIHTGLIDLVYDNKT